MRGVAIISLVMAVAMAGCRSKREVVTGDYSASVVDTSRVVVDSRQVATENTSIETSGTTHEDGTRIEFADSGGGAAVDPAGRIVLWGVRSISLGHRDTSAHARVNANRSDSAAIHAEADAGLTTEESGQIRAQTGTIARRPWYERVLITVGTLCCIAALMWLLFLYLKRKF